MEKDNKKLELILKIVNCILFPIVAFTSFRLIFVFLFIFACAFGGTACLYAFEDSNLLSTFGPEKIPFLLITIFSICLIISIFNYIMKRLMKKNNMQNTNNQTFPTKIKKIKYLLCTYFLGIFGIHKFLIKDKKSGYIYLLLLLCPIIITIFDIIIPLHIDIYIGVILIFCPIYILFGLLKSDITIAKAKISDENGIISFN